MDNITENHRFVLEQFAKQYTGTDDPLQIDNFLSLFFSDEQAKEAYYDECFDSYFYSFGRYGNKHYLLGVNKYTDDLNFCIYYLDKKLASLRTVTKDLAVKLLTG